MTNSELVLEALQTRPLSSSVLNALVTQKNTVLELIGKGEDSLFEAKKLLDVLHPLWNVLGYGHKGRELYRILRDAARKELNDNQDFISLERKNSKVRGITLHHMAKLDALIAEC